MSEEGPKAYPVVYDADADELQYSFQTGYFAVPFQGPAPLTASTIVASAIPLAVTSTSFVPSTALTVDFAVSDASHQVEIIVSGDELMTNGDGATTLIITLYVDGVDSSTTGAGYSSYFPTTDMDDVIIPVAFSSLIAPGDTDVHTYAVYIRLDNSGPTGNFPYNNGRIGVKEVY